VIRLGDLPASVRGPQLAVVDIGGRNATAVGPAAEAPAVKAAPLLATAPVLSGSPPPARPLEAVAAELRGGVRPVPAPAAVDAPGDDPAPPDEDDEPTVIRPHGLTPTPTLQLPIDLPTMLRDLENAYINAALTHTRSNKKEAAKLLGMGRTTLVEKLRRRNTDASRS
jgi:sigma-54 specific flagellar transcriptional regulator A